MGLVKYWVGGLFRIDQDSGIEKMDVRPVHNWNIIKRFYKSLLSFPIDFISDIVCNSVALNSPFNYIKIKVYAEIY